MVTMISYSHGFNPRMFIISLILMLLIPATLFLFMTRQHVSSTSAAPVSPYPPLLERQTNDINNMMNDTNLNLHEKNDSRNSRRKLLQTMEGNIRQKSPIRVLYTITTLSEYDIGSRATTKGFDRLQNLLIPVMKQGVESMVSLGYHVDVYIVAQYNMTRTHLIRQALPNTVKLSVWDNATPYTYDPGKRDDPNGKLITNTLALARQHRFVIKDNLFSYDFFCSFEDDMIIKGQHIQTYIQMTQQLFQLRQFAPDTIDINVDNNNKKKKGGLNVNRFSGELTKGQLKRMFPGLIRVEVLLDEANFGTQTKLDPVPIASTNHQVNVETCCHLNKDSVSSSRPEQPSSSKVFLWETGIEALGVRKMPSPKKMNNGIDTGEGDGLGWVMLQRGPRPRDGELDLMITDYWSGQDGYFDEPGGGGKARRPAPGEFGYINNQGGWMATRQQIWEWHTEICPGGFLPPYDRPHYSFDGMDQRNVEYWSGGLHLYTPRHACNLQRIISLEPTKFANQLIYHSANNKQRQLSSRKRKFVKIDHLYGQLLTVQRNAQKRLDQALMTT